MDSGDNRQPGRGVVEFEEDVSSKFDQLKAHLDEHCTDQLDGTDVVLDEATDDTFLLTDLPTEILIHIASFLDSRDIGTSLYRTCKLFHDFFSHERYWKTRVLQRWPKPYPIFDCKFFLLLSTIYLHMFTKLCVSQLKHR